MKKQNTTTAVILIMSLFTFSACLDFTTETIRGNGELTSSSKELGPFHSLSVNGLFKTTYVVDPQYKISIVGESNLLDYLIIEVDNGVLTIKTPEEISLSPKEDINLLIQGPPLKSISQTGSGDMVLGTITNDSAINLIMTGSGSISGQVNVPNVSMNLIGSGSIAISGTVVGAVTEVTGSGSINAAELQSAGAEATVRGSGSIYTGSSDRLKANVLGSGNVYYAGDPELTSTVTGSGKIIQRNSAE